jgi:hypothetical protein
MACRLEVGISLLLTGNSNLGKPVEDPAWGGMSAAGAGMGTSRTAGRYYEVSPLTVRSVGSIDG